MTEVSKVEGVPLTRMLYRVFKMIVDHRLKKKSMDTVCTFGTINRMSTVYFDACRFHCFEVGR
jgi:hypothetical protein